MTCVSQPKIRPATSHTIFSLQTGSQTVIRRRRYVLDGKPVLLSTSYFPADIVRGTLIEQEDTGPGGAYARLADAGEPPVWFQEDVTARMSTPEEATQLWLPAGAPVLVIRRTVWGSDRAWLGGQRDGGRRGLLRAAVPLGELRSGSSGNRNRSPGLALRADHCRTVVRGNLQISGYTDVDPQATLGGPDGKKDILARRGGQQFVAAVYFPPTPPSFGRIRAKFLSDRKGVRVNDADGFIFFVNQYLTLGQRNDVRAPSPFVMCESPRPAKYRILG